MTRPRSYHRPTSARAILEHGGFLIDGLEVHRYKDIVDVSTLLRDYGGNERVLVHEAGPNQGLTFRNDHESGLFAMECFGSFVEEVDLESEDPNTILASVPSLMDEEYERYLGHLMSEIRWNPPNRSWRFSTKWFHHVWG